jgi:hypothetical protein
MEPRAPGVREENIVNLVPPPLFIERRPGWKKLCDCCGNTAVARLTIRNSSFRGDDDVYQVCEDHLSMARKYDWVKFFGDMKAEKKSRSQK